MSLQRVRAGELPRDFDTSQETLTFGDGNQNASTAIPLHLG